MDLISSNASTNYTIKLISMETSKQLTQEECIKLSAKLDQIERTLSADSPFPFRVYLAYKQLKFDVPSNLKQMYEPTTQQLRPSQTLITQSSSQIQQNSMNYQVPSNQAISGAILGQSGRTQIQTSVSRNSSPQEAQIKSNLSRTSPPNRKKPGIELTRISSKSKDKYINIEPPKNTQNLGKTQQRAVMTQQNSSISPPIRCDIIPFATYPSRIRFSYLRPASPNKPSPLSIVPNSSKLPVIQKPLRTRSNSPLNLTVRQPAIQRIPGNSLKESVTPQIMMSFGMQGEGQIDQQFITSMHHSTVKAEDWRAVVQTPKFSPGKTVEEKAKYESPSVFHEQTMHTRYLPPEIEKEQKDQY